MFKLAKLVGSVALAGMAGVVFAQDVKTYEGIGRLATPNEVAAWDIDVRPDFVGLPKGSGTVEDGMGIWDTQCASCHGTFGESNEVFTPIIGGTTAKDQETGRVASLTDPNQPQRSTLMKVPTVSTLWDYIHRAMPWTNPRTLSVDDTYAVLAYILYLGEIVDDEFVLNEQTIKEVQERMPNRNGMTLEHGMWQRDGKPDVNGSDCMTNCVTAVEITSTLPDYARNAHYNIAEQNRIFGPFRGADTTKPPVAELPGANFQTVAMTTAAPASSGGETVDVAALFKANNCAACHAADMKMVGPSIKQVAEKYDDKPETLAMLAGKVKNGAVGTWGQIPMPPHPQVSEENINLMVQWMVSGGQ
ncbi:c-type cytochrome [Orrella daihaiensis]|uniref:C-type cytochrome n=1 Tax=Orrella daihaiensis TaxID=2782176 RepID=A0ABY4AHB2_9BURK|nr:c-type cytochrome [Orrella daihaiensis]UOD49678.1 c-type cytochrome [Orrella daihaiensis]